MSRVACALATLLVVGMISLTGVTHAADGSVDLHAHLFMDRGLGWMFNGDFDSPLQANSWDDELSSKINAESLEASGLDVVVVALFAHPVFRADMRQSVREQIALVERFIASHEQWSLARNAADVKRITDAGGRAMVLSLEGASGVLESEQDLREFIDQRGISIVTELHLVDDRYGGAALLDDSKHAANPHALVDQLLDPNVDDHGLQRNRMGLTPLGKRLAIELIKRGVWIDLTHASDAAMTELATLVELAKQPLLFTHTSLRQLRPIERALSDDMLHRVARSRGIIGLIPTEDAFQRAPASDAFCPEGCSSLQCRGSVHAFARMYQRVAAVVGADSVMLGSDHNGAMRHLRPACGTGTELDAEAGLFHIGQTPQLWGALRKLGAPVPPAGVQLARFIDAWSAVQPRDVTALVDPDGSLPPLPAHDEVQGPSLAVRVGAGVSGGNTGADPGLLLQLDMRLRKDVGSDIEVEPMVYLLHGNADVSLTPANDVLLPFAEGSFAPVGVQLRHLDNIALAEALRLRLRRHDALDQKLVIQAALVRGLARWSPWNAHGERHLFVQLDTELMGYKHLQHLEPTHRDLHAVFIAGGKLLVGASVYPAPALRFSLYGGIGSDFSIITSSPTTSLSYQADIGAVAGLRVGTSDGRFVQFFELHQLANRELHQRSVLLTTPHLRGGVSAAF